MNLKTFFQPKSVAVIGASTNPKKLGNNILQNIIEAQFEGDIFAINPKHAGKEIQGKPCFRSLSEIKKPVDIAIIVIPSKFVELVIDEAIKNKTKNIIIISAGFGEIGDHELENKIQKKCKSNNINLLGPNCLGAIFPHAKLNASFADGFPKQGNICFVSQSGAFCTATLDWANQKNIGFSHFISLGNKAGITESDIIENLSNDPTVGVFVFYLESVAHGPKFLEAIRKIAEIKPVIILAPGKSEKAAIASSSHTGSLAPNARVIEAAYKASGAIQVYSMREMFHIIEIFNRSNGKRLGSHLAVLTNAGGVGVLTSDLSEEDGLELVNISAKTQKKLQSVLPPEATTKNPIDIIGDATAQRYKKALSILSKDDDIDQILVLLTPQRTTEIKKTAQIISKLARQTNKNIVASFVGGEKVREGFQILESNGIPIFKFPSDATRALGKIANRNENLCRLSKTKRQRNPEIEKSIKNAQLQKLKSLPQVDVDIILKHYKLDFPTSQNFRISEKEKAKLFFKNLIKKNNTFNKAVLKISAPEALHKTDLQGVILNINSDKKFNNAWNILSESIQQNKLDNASIQVQEQINDDRLEIFTGINTDPNFGKVMVFGTGGIFTEIVQDTSLRVLPTYNEKCITNMINETKAGVILNGSRGKKFAKKATEKMCQTIENIVLDFPEIQSIDANPVLVTEDRVICVDFKILL